MSSLSYNKVIEGLTRQVIRSPKYVICFRLDKHTKNTPNEDRSVERPVTTNNVNTPSYFGSPGKCCLMP